MQWKCYGQTLEFKKEKGKRKKAETENKNVYIRYRMDEN